MGQVASFWRWARSHITGAEHSEVAGSVSHSRGGTWPAICYRRCVLAFDAAAQEIGWQIFLGWAWDAITWGPPLIYGSGDSGPGHVRDGAITDPQMLELLTAPWLAVSAFIWGTLWGSFSNVVIWRLPRGENLAFPASHCGACQAPIAWYDNIPIVSYIVLGGRCRKCKSKYSMRYLVVELLAGTLSFALYRAFFVVPLLDGAPLLYAIIAWQLWFFFCMALLVVTYVDLDLWIIPDEIVLPVGVIGLLCSAIAPDLLGVELPIALASSLGGLLLVVAIRALYLKLRGVEALGLGDGKLLFMVGAFTGPVGLAWTLGAGALQGLLISVPMLLLGGKVANSDLHEVHGEDPLIGENDPDAAVMEMRVPFGPFLALAALEWVLAGDLISPLIRWLAALMA